jgi:UDP-galactopyranose mutase
MRATTKKIIVERRKRRRPNTLVCLSHLRWNFVYQRPQHLMSRLAADRRVLFIEEPVASTRGSYLSRTHDASGVEVIVPHLGHGNAAVVLARLLDEMFEEQKIHEYSLWYYTPMAMEWTSHLSPTAVIYDCMDELTAFKNAPSTLREWELLLLGEADVVFTGGNSLFNAKKHQHDNIYPFPSSIDVSHFSRARDARPDPDDQAAIPHKRLGYVGVIDERMDLDLIAAVADLRPDWHLVLLGPVVKIDEAVLPKRANIHYLGMKSYDHLPQYLGGWDVALLPFARNESTRFISPTKTPEYLAAGLPVVSTSIQDVVEPYGMAGVVHVADDPLEFVSAIERALAEDSTKRIIAVEQLLANNCWSRTSRRMSELIEDAVARRNAKCSTHSIAAVESLPTSALPG